MGLGRVYIEPTMTTPTETPEPKLCTLRRPAGTSATTFVVLGERAWLITSGSRHEWRCLDIATARAEWTSLLEQGHERSEQHVVEVMAVAELLEPREHVIEDDRGLRMYRAGTARAGLCPVLRSTCASERRSSWWLLLDVEITIDTTKVRKVGSSSVEMLYIYDYDVATTVVTGELRWGCRFHGVSDKIGVERRTLSCGHLYYSAREIAA